jgi:16S rRNA U516 pseudouridylate synthase RsuA-like enzyme
MEVSVQNSSGTITWLGLTCNDNRTGIIKKIFSALYLDLTRLICVGFGPFSLDNVLPAEKKGGIAEVKLPPEISALYHEIQNNKIVNTRTTVSGF